LEILAIDVALLLPEAVNARACAISDTLEDEGFRFDETHLPHVTLLQQFVAREHLPALSDRIDKVARATAAVTVRVTGIEQYEDTPYLAIERTPALQRLHENLLEEAASFHLPAGGPTAFHEANDEPPRPADILWVTRFRVDASRDHFWPHVTLGKGKADTGIEPFHFTATNLALCHLGRFCTCRIVLREWTLG